MKAEKVTLVNKHPNRDLPPVSVTVEAYTQSPVKFWVSERGQKMLTVEGANFPYSSVTIDEVELADPVPVEV